MTRHGFKAATASEFVGGHLVDGIVAALDVGALAHSSDERVDGLSLGLAIGVEPELLVSLAVLRTMVQVAITTADDVEDILSAVALGVLGLERVALDHQQGIVLVLCQMHRLP